MSRLIKQFFNFGSLSSNKLFRSFVTDSFVYTGVNLVTKAIPFLLLPIIINSVTADEYGLYSLFMTTEALMIPMVGLNLHGALNRHYYDKEELDLTRYISSIFWVQLANIVLISGIVLLLPSSVVSLTGISKWLFQLAVLSSGAMAVINLLTVLFRVQRRPKAFGVFVVLQALMLFTSIIVLLQIEKSAQFIIFGRLLNMVLFFAVAVGLLVAYRLVSIQYDKKLLRRALDFALPTIPHAFAAFIFAASDKYLIKYFLDLENVGYYTAVLQISSLISVLAMSFNSAWIPWLFEQLKKDKEDIRRFIVKVSYWLKAGFVLAGIVFVVILPFVLEIMLTAEYQPYGYLGYLFVAGFIFQALYFIVVPYIFYIEKTKYLSILSISAAVINVALNFILIPRYGLLGAAISTCSAWVFLYFVTFRLSSKFYKMPW